MHEIAIAPAVMTTAVGKSGADSPAAHDSKEKATPEAVAVEEKAPPTKRKPAVISNQKKRIRANRFRAGVAPSASAAAARDTAVALAATGAAAPPRQTQNKKTARDLPVATFGSTTTPPLDSSISATAIVAKRAVDNLFDIAALQLSAGQSPTTASAERVEKTKGVSKEAVVAAGGARVSQSKKSKGSAERGGASRTTKPGATPLEEKVVEVVMLTERVLPFAAELAADVTVRDILEVASSRSWVGGAEEGPRGVLTGVLATAQALTEKVNGLVRLCVRALLVCSLLA